MNRSRDSVRRTARSEHIGKDQGVQIPFPRPALIRQLYNTERKGVEKMRHHPKRRNRKRKPPKSKEQNLFGHVRQRAAKRYGIVLDVSAQDAICRLISQGEAQLIRQESLRVNVWDVNFQGRKMRVCYDKKRRQLITALTPRGEDKGDSAQIM